MTPPMAKLITVLEQHLDKQPPTDVTLATTWWETILAYVKLMECGLGMSLPASVSQTYVACNLKTSHKKFKTSQARWERYHNTFTPSLNLVPFCQLCLVFVSCVHRRVVEGSGEGIARCVVHVDVHGVCYVVGGCMQCT